MIRKIISALFVSMTLSSCSIYRQTFDCEPGVGVGCKSVSEIESSVVERVDGEDLFILQDSSGCKGCTKKSVPQVNKGIASSIRAERIWFVESATPNGNLVDGHYIYFPVVDEWQQTVDLKALYEES